MNISDLKKITVIQKFIEKMFSDGEWAQLSTLTSSSKIIYEHPRLFRAQSFGDPDYPSCVVEVITRICEADPNNLESILDFFEIEDWYKIEAPERYARIFGKKHFPLANFWKNGYLKIFVSHLAVSKEKAAQLKSALLEYGITCFVAHDDIEPTKEWMTEIELGLNTMEGLIAMVEPEFKNSNWTDQEIGFALARQVEIIPLRMGADPHGFLGKYQGVQAKGRFATDLAIDIFKILVKKTRYREKLLSAMYLTLKNDKPDDRVMKVNLIDGFGVLSNNEMKDLLENASLGYSEKIKLDPIIKKYEAFKTAIIPPQAEDDLPF